MKFANLSKLALLSLLAGIVALSGCGATNNLALTQGNWSMTATSSGALGTFYLGGNLTQSGASLTGTLEALQSCISSSPAMAFTGTVHGNKITLTSNNASGQVIAITASGTTGSLTGTYTVTGGTCADGDKGSITATPVPSISGTWSGPIVGDGNSDPNVTLVIALTQGTTSSADGTFGLTGNITYTGSTCSQSGTLPADSSFVVGPYVVLTGTTDDGATFSYSALLDNAASPKSLHNGTYQTSGGNCDDLISPVTLTKQ
jgi:hypothetical protein